MSDEKLSFLDQPKDEAPSSEPAPAEPAAEVKSEAADTSTERPRDPETGRFVPITALLDEREKRQAETRRREELEQQLQRYQQPQEEYIPQDPRELLQITLEQQQKVAFNERLNMSEIMARQAHGDDAVAAAQRAFLEASQQNPALGEQLQGQVHPYDFVMRWHKQHQLMSEIGQDPDAWRKAETERIRQQVLAELSGKGVSPQPSRSSQQPPPSIVNNPSSGRADSIPVGPGYAFEGLFSKG